MADPVLDNARGGAARYALRRSGGTGRRARLRGVWGNPWGFESPLRHHDPPGARGRRGSGWGPVVISGEGRGLQALWHNDQRRKPLPRMTQTLPVIQPDALRELQGRKPAWLKVRAPGGPNYMRLKALMRERNLHTVCEEARCPNIGECWEERTATFMILGDVCTRRCRFCAVAHGRPEWEDWGEPDRVGRTVAEMGLQHVVVTSVNRDDLADGGSGIFARTITAIRREA